MGWTRARNGARCGRGSPVCTPTRRAYATGVVRFRFVMSSQLSGPVGNSTSLMPRASARWVAAPAAPLPRRCLRAYPARARAAGGQGQGAGGGGYRYRAGGAMPRDPYRVLDVEMDASQAEIKLAFRQLTKRTHPDVNPSDNAAEMFRRINAAYEIVGDAERRRRFDLGNDWEVRYQILKSCNVGMPIPDSLSLTSIPNHHHHRRPWTRDGCPRRRRKHARGLPRTIQTHRLPRRPQTREGNAKEWTWRFSTKTDDKPVSIGFTGYGSNGSGGCGARCGWRG